MEVSYNLAIFSSQDPIVSPGKSSQSTCIVKPNTSRSVSLTQDGFWSTGQTRVTPLSTSPPEVTTQQVRKEVGTIIKSNRTLITDGVHTRRSSSRQFLNSLRSVEGSGLHGRRKSHALPCSGQSWSRGI